MASNIPSAPAIPYAEKRYPALNHCAYCGSTDQLSTEHIIPYALGGRLTLPDSSCEECRKATCRVEDSVLRRYLGPLRSYLSLPSRRPAQRPDGYELTLMNGIRRWKQKVKLRDHPGVIQFMIFDPPGYIAGRPKVQETYGVRPVMAHIFPDTDARMLRLGATTAIDNTNINPMDLARMIAKIGMAYAIAELGRNAFFEFYVQHLIRDEASDWNYWAGGFEYGEEMPCETLHKLSLIRRGDDLSVIVHLFPRYCPRSAYEVVVGRLHEGAQLPVY